MPATRSLAAYLDDHLAGATAALDLLARLEDAVRGEAVADEVAGLRREVGEDRQTLLDVMGVVGAEPNRLKGAASRAAETVVGLRFHDRVTGDPRLGRLLMLEALLLGVHGKRALWLALGEVQHAGEGALRDRDFAAMTQRADRQHDLLERMRRETVRDALTGRP